jgi:polyisoprenoid-binding protein YceI
MQSVAPKLWIPIAGVAGLIALGAAGGYAYFFSGLRSSPSALTLPTPHASASASTTSGSGAGTWTVASGSVAGYRVREQFVGQSTAHQAVARTSDVTGEVTIARSNGVYEMTSATINVKLSSLTSVDSVAGYNVTNRDRIVQQALDVQTYPTATFTARSVALPPGADSGQTVTVSVPGELTVHGVTKAITATIQLRVTGSTAQMAGTIDTNMTDFGVSPPAIGFTTVQPAVTIEFSLILTQGS